TWQRNSSDVAWPPLPRAAASSFLSSRQNRQRANRTAPKRRTCRRPSTHPPLAFAQSSGTQLDQISIASTRRPRFSPTKVSATPPKSVPYPDHDHGVAETSPLHLAKNGPTL